MPKTRAVMLILAWSRQHTCMVHSRGNHSVRSFVLLTHMCPVEDGSLIVEGYPRVLLDVARPAIEVKMIITYNAKADIDVAPRARRVILVKTETSRNYSYSRSCSLPALHTCSPVQARSSLFPRALLMRRTNIACSKLFSSEITECGETTFVAGSIIFQTDV
jgi:hypothetical protein